MKYSPKLDTDERVEGGLSERMNNLWERRPKSAEELYKYRQELLSSEETKVANLMLDNYRSAYQAKDNMGLFDEMELAEKYWSGSFGEPEDFDDPGSNTNIINTNVETQVAGMVDQTIDIELKPYEPADKPYVEKARLILDRIKDANKLPKKIERHERRKCKFGTGILRVMYNKSLNPYDKIGCPEIKVCNPAYIFPDPNIVNLDDLQEAQFIIETMPKSIWWAEKKFGKERAWAIAPGYNPTDSTFVFREDQEPNYDVNGDHYLHILYWCKTESGKLRLIQMSGCGIILSDTENDPEYNYFTDDGRYPYFFTVDMEREGTIWGKSICSLLFSLQDEIDDYTDMIRRNARLCGNPIKLVSTNSGLEIDKLDNTAGQVLPVNDINGIKYLEPPNMPAFIQQRRSEAIDKERSIITRITDQQAGIRQSGVQTATESLNLAQAANVTTDTRKAMLQDTLNDVFRYCFELALNYWNTNMFFQSKDEFEYFNPSELKKIPMMKPATSKYVESYMQRNPDAEPPKFMLSKEKRPVKFVFNIQVGAGLPSNKAVAFNYVLESYKGGLISKEECRELMIEYIKLPVEVVDNAVIELEKKQIEFQSMQLDLQMAQMSTQLAPSPMQAGGMVSQGNSQGIEEMQSQPNARATAIENPRPNTLSIIEGEKNLV